MKQLITITIFLILFIACEEEQQYPLANYKLINEKGIPGFMQMLDASSSISFAANRTLSYRWDLDGDHALEWDTDWLNEPTCFFIFQDTYETVIGLQVKDEFNHITEFYNVNYYYLGMNDYYINDDIARKFNQTSIQYSDIQQTWLKSNLFSKDSIGIFNPYQRTPIQPGSYYTWETATNRFKINEEKEHPTSDDYWVVPSLEQWQVLINYYGSELVAGYNLTLNLEKSINLPYAGYLINEVLTDFEQAGYYWTSTKFDDTHAYAIKVIPNEYKVETVVLPTDVAASVRLLIQYQSN